MSEVVVNGEIEETWPSPLPRGSPQSQEHDPPQKDGQGSQATSSHEMDRLLNDLIISESQSTFHWLE